MQAEVRWVNGMTFLGRGGSNHWVSMDVPVDKGGEGAGSSPMELVLLGLGGCTAVDVVSILQKKRQEVTGLTVTLRGERAEEHPKRFVKIETEFRVQGKDLSQKAVEDAVRLSEERYCSVAASLAPDIQRVTTIVIE